MKKVQKVLGMLGINLIIQYLIALGIASGIAAGWIFIIRILGG